MKNARSPTETYKFYQGMLINRIIRMFEFKNMPESIDVDYLNYTLITTGNIGFTKINGKLYSLFGNVGGEPNVYYFPRLYIIDNPVVGSKQFNIDIDGVVMFNTTVDRFVQPKHYQSPLNSLIDITAQQLTEVTTSALSACKNIRAAIFISAKDEETKQAALLALSKIYDGDPCVIFKDKIIESLNIIPNPVIGEAAKALSELREEYQFYLAQFYNAIGINSNYNMKRERLNTAEVNTNTDSLLINITDMLYQRQTAVTKINAMFGTEITVDFSDEWKKTEALQNNPDDSDPDDSDPDDSDPDDKGGDDE